LVAGTSKKVKTGGRGQEEKKKKKKKRQSGEACKVDYQD